MRQRVPPLGVRLLVLAFVCIVIAIDVQTKQLIIPIFLGLITWGKAWLKTLTPKVAIYFLKNGLVIQLRQLLVKVSTHLLVNSHKPWRKAAHGFKVAAIEKCKNLPAAYLRMPLWLRCAVAIGLLLATAGSSLAVFALLIIPQPVLDWLRGRVAKTLNKLGVTQFFAALYRFLVPTSLRYRWHMHVKWTIGRRQVRAAAQLAKTVQNLPKPKINVDR